MMVRWEFERIVSPHWGAKPTILIGAGASLQGHDLRVLKSRVHACAVKGAIFDHQWADAGFGLDLVELRRWWMKFHRIKIPVWWAVPDRWSNAKYPAVKPNCLRFVQRTTLASLSDDNGTINGGGTSGFGALNFAYLKRSRFIVLFGYDYGPTGSNWHANDEHYNAQHRYDVKQWLSWASAFDKVIDQLHAAGVEVINASPNSNIVAFKKVTVEEGIRLCQ